MFKQEIDRALLRRHTTNLTDERRCGQRADHGLPADAGEQTAVFGAGHGGAERLKVGLSGSRPIGKNSTWSKPVRYRA